MFHVERNPAQSAIKCGSLLLVISQTIKLQRIING